MLDEVLDSRRLRQDAVACHVVLDNLGLVYRPRLVETWLAVEQSLMGRRLTLYVLSPGGSRYTADYLRAFG